jgi:hypothetical protein
MSGSRHLNELCSGGEKRGYEDMKKAAILILLVLSFMTFASAAEKPIGVEEYTSVDELAVAISKYFPKVQG